jgi:site-specific DNA-methyltransferase (adenine-specific)
MLVEKSLVDKIVLGDAIEVMKEIPTNSIQMTFADPPFNLKKSYGHYLDSKQLGEYNRWCKQWIGEMVRITSDTGSIFVHNLPRWLTYHSYYLNRKARFRHWIAWDAMGAPLGKTLLPNHYGLLYYVKSDKFKFNDLKIPHPRCRSCGELLADYGGKKRLIHPFGILLSDVWTDIHRIRHSTRRDVHPCQLPIHLLERLILMTTDENDTILDPFLGTGTTAIAAKKMGRHYIGIDIDQEYVELAKRKVNEAHVTRINGCYVSIFLNKIQTLRDKDYEKIKMLLKTEKLKVNGGIFKQLTLPYYSIADEQPTKQSKLATIETHL